MGFSWKVNLYKDNITIGLISLFSVCFHLLFYEVLEFHRDELLYLSLGEHPDFGYYSVPPLIGFFGFLSLKIFGYGLMAAKFLPALLGGIVIYLSSMIAKELKGGFYAQVLTAICILGSLLFVRAFSLFQPVPVEIFFWTLSFYFVIKLINTDKERYIFFFFITIGLGLLNKYNIIFLVISLLLTILFTRHRKLFLLKNFYFSVLIMFIIILPNIIWQISHHLPVIHHMSELRETQLVNMNPETFLLEQILMIFPATFIVIPGIFFLLFNSRMKPYRWLGIASVIVLLIYLVMKGKGYYSAGIYPFLIAAGAVFIDNLFKRKYLLSLVIVPLLFLEWLILPMGVPVYGPQKLTEYFDRMAIITGNDAVRRDEDNRYHKLPQDYSDMLGWNELTDLTNQAWKKVEKKNSGVIFCENYGQAGAVNIIGKKYNLPAPLSFCDNFKYWSPESFSNEISTVVYVNDTIGDDVVRLFGDIEEIGQVSNRLAREYGVKVYLCKDPKMSFNRFWHEARKSAE